jgi:methionyl-tRNA formyltransferase
MPLRLIFMGTPDFAVPTLIELAGRGHDIAAIYTRAPKPAGRRGLELTPSPVEREARKLGLNIETPASLKSAEAQAAFAAYKADAAVVVAYGLILPKPVLDAPALGCFNLHASLLPRWRGAAPIHRAIMAGDAETGVAVMKMDEGLDTGAVAMLERVPIPPDLTAGQLHDALARLGADLMARAMSALERGTLQFAPQPADGVTYATKIDKAETRIEWARPWTEVHNRIRGLSPFPGAWCEWPGAGRVKLLRSTGGEANDRAAPGTVLDDRLTVACGEGAVRIVELQKAGGRPMKTEEFLRGTPVAPGLRLG